MNVLRFDVQGSSTCTGHDLCEGAYRQQASGNSWAAARDRWYVRANREKTVVVAYTPDQPSTLDAFVGVHPLAKAQGTRDVAGQLRSRRGVEPLREGNLIHRCRLKRGFNHRKCPMLVEA